MHGLCFLFVLLGYNDYRTPQADYHTHQYNTPYNSQYQSYYSKSGEGVCGCMGEGEMPVVFLAC